MEVIYNTIFLSWALLCIVCVLVLSKAAIGLKFWTTLVAVILIPVPVYIGDSPQKMLYAFDIVGALTVVYLLLQSLTGRLFQLFLTYHCRLCAWGVTFSMVLLLLSPLISNIFQLVYSDSINLQLMLLSTVRSIFAFSMLISVVYAARSGKIDFDLLLQCVAVVFAVVAVTAGANFITSYRTDVMEVLALTSEITEWTGGYGGGVVGLYRGEYGAYFAQVLPFALLAAVRDRRLVALTGIGVVCGLYAVISVGSRQGVVAAIVGLTILAMSTVLKNGVDARSRFSLALDLSLFSAISVSSLLIIAAIDINYINWVLDRFSVFSSSTSDVVADISMRDPRVYGIIDEVLGNWHRYIFGMGYGGFGDSVVKDEWRVVYVDSELVWVLQQNGILGLVSYAGLLTLWFRVIHRMPPLPWGLGYYAVFGVAAIFLYGHYVFMNWQTAHTPLAAILWLYVALAFGMEEHRKLKLIELLGKR